MVAGRTEFMSRSQHIVSAARFGQKFGSVEMADALLAVLSAHFVGMHMGVTAENIASDYGIMRERQDELAAESHRGTAFSQSEGRVAEQILPIEIKSKKGTRLFDANEHVRSETDMAGLAKLRTVFQKDGSVTAGNASGINDGAAAVLLASEAEATRADLKPWARVIGWGLPECSPIALERAGLSLDQIDVIESNEAFAAQACAVADALAFPRRKSTRTVRAFPSAVRLARLVPS